MKAFSVGHVGGLCDACGGSLVIAQGYTPSSRMPGTKPKNIESASSTGAASSGVTAADSAAPGDRRPESGRRFRCRPA